MSGLDKDRIRNKTISFRVSPEEHRQLEARIKISGMAKGEYIIQLLLSGQITIAIGKYQSDRLSLELKRLREQIKSISENNNSENLVPLIKDCKALLNELLLISTRNKSVEKLSASDFATEK